MTFIMQRAIGSTVRPKMEILPGRMAHWRYAKENTFTSGGLTTAATLTVVDKDTRNSQWIVLEVPSDPPTRIKLSGEEFARLFE